MMREQRRTKGAEDGVAGYIDEDEDDEGEEEDNGEDAADGGDQGKDRRQRWVECVCPDIAGNAGGLGP